MRIFGILCAFLLALPATALAQDYGWQFQLNDRTITTNPDRMSGPYGCRSNLANTDTGETVCPFDGVADPASVWRTQVAMHCDVVRRGQYSAYGFYANQCIGGYVAVGDNCPQRPRGCTYYRIAEEGTWQGNWMVPASRIHELGNELWIARPGTGLMGLFSRCWEAQGLPNRAHSRC
jgi:hypothetical protein